MDRGLRERVRWGNVARALGLVAVAGVVVAWPVLAPEAPVVPGTEAVPVVPGPAGTPVAPSRATPAPRLRVMRPRRVLPQSVRSRARPGRRGRRRVAPAVPRRRVRGERRAGEGGGGAVPDRPTPVVPLAPPVSAAPVAPPARAVPVAPPAVAGQGTPAPPDPDPVVREFGPEGG